MSRTVSVLVASLVCAAGCASAPEATTTLDVPASPSASAASTSTEASRAPAKELVLEVSPQAIGFAGEPPIVELGPDLTKGIDASFKRSGENDLYIVPIAQAIVTERARGHLTNALRLRVAPATPYRVLFEVLFTAGQTEIEHYEMTREGTTAVPLAFTPPHNIFKGADPSQHALNLVALIVGAGVALKTSSGNVVPGCDAIGPGITIARDSGAPIPEGPLRACAEKLKASDPAFANEKTLTVSANPGTPIGEVFDVLDALRTTSAGAPLFPDVHFGVVR